MEKIDFFVSRSENNEDFVFSYEIEKIICVGFSGRNQKETLKHIEELKEEGVPAPDKIPTIYPCSKNLATNNSKIQVLGDKTSGEVEAMLLFYDDSIYLGIGSDHTDRNLETVDIGKSKQSCSKPFSRILWKLSDIEDHIDEMILRSWSIKNGNKELYQEGKLKNLLPLDEIIKNVKNNYQKDLKGCMVYCGSVPTKSGLSYGEEFKMEIEDPVLSKKLSHDYKIEKL